MDSSQSILSPTTLLLCKENHPSLDDDYDKDEVFMESYDDDYIKMLLDTEIPTGLLKSSIQEQGIDYILRKGDLFGFGFHTAYLSVVYFDRFLSIRDVEKPWAVRLLAMGCLSLAAKMEEKRVPSLAEFCEEDYFFDKSVIQRMELLVLNTLEWKMGAITPFHFLHFFADKFRSGNTFSTTLQVISDAMRDAKIMGNKASVIAAASSLFVFDQGLKRDTLELKISPLNSTHSFNIESIISCYGLLQRLKLSKGVKSSAKRKRLVFNEDDEKKG